MHTSRPRGCSGREVPMGYALHSRMPRRARIGTIVLRIPRTLAPAGRTLRIPSEAGVAYDHKASKNNPMQSSRTAAGIMQFLFLPRISRRVAAHRDVSMVAIIGQSSEISVRPRSRMAAGIAGGRLNCDKGHARETVRQRCGDVARRVRASARDRRRPRAWPGRASGVRPHGMSNDRATSRHVGLRTGHGRRHARAVPAKPEARIAGSCPLVALCTAEACSLQRPDPAPFH